MLLYVFLKMCRNTVFEYKEILLFCYPVYFLTQLLAKNFFYTFRYFIRDMGNIIFGYGIVNVIVESKFQKYWSAEEWMG